MPRPGRVKGRVLTTSDKLLAVLGLFSMQRPEWTVEAAAQELGLPISTTYRYFRSLSAAGLIVAFAAGRYVLGPAIIQYDRQTRLLDPLISTAEPVMQHVARHAAMSGVVLLCRLFGDQIMCVHQECHERPPFAVSYERGRPMPIYRGANSKIILANMPLRRIKSLQAQHGDAMAAAGLGRDWAELKAKLRAFRTIGVAITHAELDPGVIGVAAPVFDPAGDVMGSIGLVISIQHGSAPELARATGLVLAGSREIAAGLAKRASSGPIAHPFA